MKDNRVITPDHEVAQYIRGYKIHMNTPWESVDYVCILINLPEACHWVLAVICIKIRCIHVFDSLWSVRSKHSVVAISLVKQLAQMIPLFFISIGFYGKRNDIDMKNQLEFMDCGIGDQLKFFIADKAPQQCSDSNDCGVFTCVFAEYIFQGHLDICSCFIDPELFLLRYGALLWDYGTRKIESDAVSDSEVTGKIVSRLSAPSIAREYIHVSDNVVDSKLLPKKK